MDALKSVRAENTQHQASQGEPLGESLAISQSGTEEAGVVTDEPGNVIQKCSKKHLREGECWV